MLMILIGAILVVIPFFVKLQISFFSWFYGIPIFIIGLVIFFNKKEDKIEEIRRFRK